MCTSNVLGMSGGPCRCGLILPCGRPLDAFVRHALASEELTSAAGQGQPKEEQKTA
jgi:hypothetical protein